jgi:hypothetical protein
LRLLARHHAALWSFPPRLGLVENAGLEETSARIGTHLANPGSEDQADDALREWTVSPRLKKARVGDDEPTFILRRQRRASSASRPRPGLGRCRPMTVMVMVMVMIMIMIMVTIHAMRAMVAILIVIFGKFLGLFYLEALLLDVNLHGIRTPLWG